MVGGATIRPGDAVVLDGDGVAVVAAERVTQVLEAAHEREAKEREAREARRPARSPTTSTACARVEGGR